MQLAFVDWMFIVGYCFVAFGIGVYFSRRASKNIGEFFIAGRNLPWWLAGTSIVATTFAADTPLAVSGLARGGGIYSNWFWWSGVMGGMLCVFFYARLWRRARIITDIEFIELRYDGPQAATLRGFMALYGGVLQNCIVMSWVMLAMVKICEVMFNLAPIDAALTSATGIELAWGKLVVIAVLLLFALGYTVLSGFWGVVMTDLIQFVMAMTGSLALAGIVLYKLGGPSGMVTQLQASPDFKPEMFHFIPDFATAGKLAVITFVVQISIQWWGGGQGGGYLAQRLFATKNEKHSAMAALWFNFAHYVLRPWPWLIVGLGSVVFFTNGELIPEGMTEPDFEKAYPLMMARFLPVGLKGLMVASMLAAFMSTMDTQLNWGASYLVNDLYKRFLVRNAADHHYVNASRVAMLILMILASLAAWQSDSIKEAWIYLAKLTAGAGFVGLLRWYWWRVNAWSEISALLGSLVIANANLPMKLLHKLGAFPDAWMERVNWLYSGDAYAVLFTIIVVTCTIIWLIVTHLTRPVRDDHLKEFYRRVRPGGWWGPLAASCPDVTCEGARHAWQGFLAGVVCIYSGLFGIGFLCVARTSGGLLLLVVSAVAGWYMVSRVSIGSDDAAA
ncbi:MAG: Na+:solute symporter [bacterium]|nr:Na+:solute symporter [bacterium]